MITVDPLPTPGFLMQELRAQRSKTEVAAAVTRLHAEFVASLPEGLDVPELKVTANDLTLMENNEIPIPGDMVPLLKKVLQLNDKTYNALLHTRFPALDEEWLKAQPADKQDITLFQTVLEMSGLFKDLKEMPIPIGYDRLVEGERRPPKNTLYAVLPFINRTVGAIRKLNEMMDEDMRWYTPELEKRFYQACNNLKHTIRQMSEKTGHEIS